MKIPKSQTSGKDIVPQRLSKLSSSDTEQPLPNREINDEESRCPLMIRKGFWPHQGICLRTLGKTLILGQCKRCLNPQLWFKPSITDAVGAYTSLLCSKTLTMLCKAPEAILYPSQSWPPYPPSPEHVMLLLAVSKGETTRHFFGGKVPP